MPGPAGPSIRSTGTGNVYSGTKIIRMIVITPGSGTGSLTLKSGGSGGTILHIFTVIDEIGSRRPIIMSFPNGWSVDTLFLSDGATGTEIMVV